MSQKIAIFGLAKTGTTALYSKIREAMPPETDCFFEPKKKHHRWRIWRRRMLEASGIARNRPLLTKILPFDAKGNEMLNAFGRFDHEILLVRDPRDRLVSSALYAIYDSSLPFDPPKLGQFVAALEARESGASRPGIMDLVRMRFVLAGQPFDQAEWLDQYARHRIGGALAFAKARPGLIEFDYDRLIRNDYAQLAAALGLTLSGEARVDSLLERVVRTKASGSWHSWFTKEDEQLFRPIFQPFLDHHYPAADWRLGPAEPIRPEHGSGYVLRIANDRRRLVGLAPLTRQELSA